MNGERRTTEDGQTILGLLQDLCLDPARVAVKHERRIVKQAASRETVLQPGSQVEIVQFVGGG